MDLIEHPPHYNAHPSGVECIELVQWMSFGLGNAVKYLYRADKKGAQRQDLLKARFYINHELERLSPVETWTSHRVLSSITVSSLGRISHAGADVLPLFRQPSGYLAFRAPTTTSNPYAHWGLYYVHVEVARTFFGDIPEGFSVVHQNGDRTNNTVSNLAMVRGRTMLGVPDDEVITSERIQMLRTSGDASLLYGLHPDEISELHAGRGWETEHTMFLETLTCWQAHEPPGYRRTAVMQLCMAHLEPTAERLTNALDAVDALLEAPEAKDAPSPPRVATSGVRGFPEPILVSK